MKNIDTIISKNLNTGGRPITVAIASPVPANGKGGIATWTRAVIQKIESDGSHRCHHINYAARPKWTDKRLWKRLFYGFIGTRNVMRDFREVQASCDVLHICSSASYGLIRDIRLLMAARRQKLPAVIHWRFSGIPELSKKKNWEWKLLMRACRLADAVIVLDQLSLETLQETDVVDKGSKIPNLITPETMGQRSADNHIVPGSILFVGNVVPFKAVDILVEACSRMNNGSTLKIVGDYEDNYHRKLMEIASKRPGDWITFTGGMPYNQVLMEMRQCSIFTLPSRHTEAFPNVLIEAMTLSKPSVVTSIGAMPEMVTPPEEPACGIVVAPEDSKALQGALETLLENDKLRAELGEQAQKRAIANYSIDAVIQRWYKLWGSLI